MGETRNTFPGGVWLPTLWPRQLGGVPRMGPQASLLVPILPPGSGEAAAKQPGDVVSRGESLLRTQPESGAMALAPVAGKVIGKVPVTLSDGRAAMAVEIWPDEAAATADTAPSDEIEKELPELPVVTNPSSEFPDWMNLLRRNGLWVDRKSSPDLLHQLTQATYRPVDTIICSVLDHDPMVRLNALLAYRHAGTI